MATLKQLKKTLKKAGLKTTGSKRALTRRAKHLMRGGDDASDAATKIQATFRGQKARQAAQKARLDRQVEKARAEAEAKVAAGDTRVRPGGARKRPTKKAPKASKKLTTRARLEHSYRHW